MTLYGEKEPRMSQKTYARMTMAERWTYRAKGSPTRPGMVPKPERKLERCPHCPVRLYPADMEAHVRRCSSAPK